jgi:hypothetical protein
MKDGGFQVWDESFRPPPLKLILVFSARKYKIKIKGGGQECPPHIT